ncbi:hypothetical protein OV203_30670 [Nannocystis sp. ILAH1]|uniref:hypothetical protein n=1 Tax=Nannocystis sp. ILAH1 TaxID=2996789 RepID=UPI00226D8510|nr:hypothetical protein [Nannocystis sp. ILAH1]MCY0991546.1 hypothetical protein [Nannocystis sp. ILAH1]
MRWTNFAPVLLLACACGPGTPQDGETDGSSSSSSTSGGPSTSDAPMTTDEPTTAEPVPTTDGPDDETCPNSEPTLTPLWSELIEQEEGVERFVAGGPLILSDGRIAVPANTRLPDSTFGVSVAWVSPDGVPLGWKTGELQTLEHLDMTGAAVAADDTVIVSGRAEVGGQQLPFIGRFDAGEPELSRSVLKTAVLDVPKALALHADDTALLLGVSSHQDGTWLARVDIDTGGALWELQVLGSGGLAPLSLTLGPAEEIVAAVGMWPNNEQAVMQVARVDAAGTLLWTRDLLEPGAPMGSLNDLVVTPDGQVVVLQRWLEPEEKITAISLALEDGATLWETEVAVANAAGPPEMIRAHVDADALLLPIGRQTAKDEPLTVELHRMSFAGQVVHIAPLTLEGRENGRPRVKVTRGRCGELVVLQEEIVPWLGSFAP